MEFVLCKHSVEAGQQEMELKLVKERRRRPKEPKLKQQQQRAKQKGMEKEEAEQKKQQEEGEEQKSEEKQRRQDMAIYLQAKPAEKVEVLEKRRRQMRKEVVGCLWQEQYMRKVKKEQTKRSQVILRGEYCQQ